MPSEDVPSEAGAVGSSALEALEPVLKHIWQHLFGIADDLKYT